MQEEQICEALNAHWQASAAGHAVRFAGVRFELCSNAHSSAPTSKLVGDPIRDETA